MALSGAKTEVAKASERRPSSQQPADIAGIEFQLRSQMPYLRAAMADLVEQSRFAKWATTTKKVIVQRPNALRDRPIEAAYAAQLIRIHLSDSSQITRSGQS